MKIGLLCCLYDCEDALDAVLAPWQEFQKLAPKLGHELIAVAINCQFAEYAEMGYPNDDNGTRRGLEKHAAFFHKIIVEREPHDEKGARTIAYRALQEKNVDLMWLLDGDEFYTVDQIKAILAFAEAHPLYDRYDLNLKNYIFDSDQWIDVEFHPPRIFRTARRGGVLEFSFDNEVRYLDGRESKHGNSLVVPREVAWITHRTWSHHRGDRKVAYQKKRFGGCAFKWNLETKKLEINEEWYKHWGDPLPVLRTD